MRPFIHVNKVGVEAWVVSTLQQRSVCHKKITATKLKINNKKKIKQINHPTQTRTYNLKTIPMTMFAAILSLQRPIQTQNQVAAILHTKPSLTWGSSFQ